MQRLVFMRRSQAEAVQFGGEVFIDIDGKNIGKLGSKDYVYEISIGTHLLKMYKSHKFDTFISLVEIEINIQDGDHLLVRYASSLFVNQPGNIVITDYDLLPADQAATLRELAVLEASKENAILIEDSKRKNSKSISIAILIASLFAILQIAVMCSSPLYS